MDNITKEEEYAKLKSICSRFYIARHITLSPESIQECIKEIDEWGKNPTETPIPE